jgi:mannose-6-phosphate isomerase-like protein (cupin superfamily)
MNTLELGPARPLIAEGSAGERITFGASEMIFKSPSAASPEGWTAIDYTLAAHQPGAPLHYHRELTESFFVISGELWMRIGDRELIAGPGSYFFVPPGTLHSFANRSEAPVRVLAHASSPHHKAF